MDQVGLCLGDHVGLTGFSLVEDDVRQDVLLVLLLELVGVCSGYVVGFTGVSMVEEEEVKTGFDSLDGVDDQREEDDFVSWCGGAVQYWLVVEFVQGTVVVLVSRSVTVAVVVLMTVVTKGPVGPTCFDQESAHGLSEPYDQCGAALTADAATARRSVDEYILTESYDESSGRSSSRLAFKK